MTLGFHATRTARCFELQWTGLLAFLNVRLRLKGCGEAQSVSKLKALLVLFDLGGKTYFIAASEALQTPNSSEPDALLASSM